MTKLSFIKRVISPPKSSAKKGLLKRDGLKSDGDVKLDDDSSSLSDRQEERRAKSKNKFDARKIFSWSAKKHGEDDDGFDSASQESSGSTRSTSSAFLRYQNKAIWKARLIKKTILQRLGDGTETPVEDEARSWPTFDRIYRRQNQLKMEDQILVGRIDVDDDDDSVSTKGSHLGFEEEVCYDVEIVQPKVSDEQKNAASFLISSTIRSFMSAGK